MEAAEFIPYVALLDTARGGQQSAVLHVFPNSATHSARAQMMSPLFVALAGLTTKLTGQQVRCATFAEPLPGFKAAYINTKDDALPQDTCQETQNMQRSNNPDKQGTLAQSCLLPWAQHQFNWLMNSVLHQLSFQGWQLVMPHLLLPFGMPVTHTTQEAQTQIEGVLSQLEMAAAAVEPLAFVGQSQACLFNRGTISASHMLPRTAHLAWMFCWAMSFFQRTAAHPSMAMLQDLQVPSHAGSSSDDISLPGSTAGTVCMRLLIVAAEQHVLCLGVWPGTDAKLQDSTGSALCNLAASCMHKLLTDERLSSCRVSNLPNAHASNTLHPGFPPRKEAVTWARPH